MDESVTGALTQKRTSRAGSSGTVELHFDYGGMTFKGDTGMRTCLIKTGTKAILYLLSKLSELVPGTVQTFSKLYASACLGCPGLTEGHCQLVRSKAKSR